MKTGVTVLSYSRLDVEAIRRATRQSPTTLADTNGIKHESVLQIPNALQTIRGAKVPIRSLESSRENHHIHVSLLCILPESTLLQVTLKTDGLCILPLGVFEGQHIVAMSGTLAYWKPTITQWLEKPTQTLREFTTQVMSALGTIGVDRTFIDNLVTKSDRLLYLE